MLRRRRWQVLLEAFPHIGQMRVLDLGGLADAWLDAPQLPREIVVLNVPAWEERVVRATEQLGEGTTVHYLFGDACDPPEEILGQHFDLVYCNSVIEHVGGHQRRVELANSIHRLADRHWVQTPYRYFPIEAHTLIPGLQFMPMHMRAAVMRRWPLGHMLKFSRDWPQAEIRAQPPFSTAYGSRLQTMDLGYSVVGAQSIELLSKAEMRVYFPDSAILSERVLGIPKSLIAVRGGRR